MDKGTLKKRKNSSLARSNSGRKQLESQFETNGLNLRENFDDKGAEAVKTHDEGTKSLGDGWMEAIPRNSKMKAQDADFPDQINGNLSATSDHELITLKTPYALSTKLSVENLVNELENVTDLLVKTQKSQQALQNLAGSFDLKLKELGEIVRQGKQTKEYNNKTFMGRIKDCSIKLGYFLAFFFVALAILWMFVKWVTIPLPKAPKGRIPKHY